MIPPFVKGGSWGISLGDEVEVGTARPSAGFPPVRGSAMLIGGAYSDDGNPQS